MNNGLGTWLGRFMFETLLWVYTQRWDGWVILDFSFLNKYLFVYLAAPVVWDLAPSPGFELWPPALEVWGPGHWTTREALIFHFKETPDTLHRVCTVLQSHQQGTRAPA